MNLANFPVSRNILVVLSLIFTFNTAPLSNVDAQCETWLELSNRDDITGSHSIYRQALRSNDMDIAIEHWRIAYENAPAADGQRDFHYTDGITIYKYKIEQTEDEALIKEYREKIIQLYEEAVHCYLHEKIALRNCTDSECYRKRAGVLLGRMTYDMFYEFKSPPSKIYEVSNRVFHLSGMDVEYIALVPAIASLSSLYRAGRIPDSEAAEFHQLIEEVHQYNVEHNDRYREQYEAVRSSIRHYVNQFESDLYDCEYFKERFIPEFEARSHDGELARTLYSRLLNRGCDENDPDLVELRLRSKAFVDSVNVAMKDDLERRNPALAARRMFEEGDFNGAVKHYKKAIDIEEDDERKGEFYFRIASIQGRQLNEYSRARRNALKAAEFKSNWGAPYILIGDLYAATSRSCGDDWDQRLAVLAAIDKYRMAARIDSEVADDARNRASRYISSKPDPQEGHMRSVSQGDRVKVGCWINETVTVRFKEN